MEPFVAVILVGVPLAWLVGFAGYAYVDAPKHGMDPRKWALLSLVVPLFGFLAYVFERDEQDYDPESDPYAGGSEERSGGFGVHESRQDERRLGPAGTEAEESDDADDEWNDPDGIDL